MIPFTIQELAEAFVTIMSSIVELIFIGMFWYLSLQLVDAWHHSIEMKELLIKKKIPVHLKNIHISFSKKKK